MWFAKRWLAYTIFLFKLDFWEQVSIVYFRVWARVCNMRVTCQIGILAQYICYKVKVYVSKEILNWRSLRADICIHFYCLSWLRQASKTKMIQSSALKQDYLKKNWVLCRVLGQFQMFCFKGTCSKAKQFRIIFRHGIRPKFLEIHLFLD